MTQYTHFDARMRNLIARKLNVDGLSFGVIAAHLGVAKSAVRNEVHRNRVRASGRVDLPAVFGQRFKGVS